MAFLRESLDLEPQNKATKLTANISATSSVPPMWVKGLKAETATVIKVIKATSMIGLFPSQVFALTLDAQARLALQNIAPYTPVERLIFSRAM